MKKQHARKENGRCTKVSYEIEEYVRGRIDFVTACPFCEKGRYTETINMVGALECNICKYQIRNNEEERFVKCSHAELERNPELKKLFGGEIGK